MTDQGDVQGIDSGADLGPYPSTTALFFISFVLIAVGLFLTNSRMDYFWMPEDGRGAASCKWARPADWLRGTASEACVGVARVTFIVAILLVVVGLVVLGMWVNRLRAVSRLVIMRWLIISALGVALLFGAVFWLGRVSSTPGGHEIRDGFEDYAVGSYPSGGGWYNEWSGREAYVSNAHAFTGEKSFRLSGYGGWVRTDGLLLDLDRAEHLVYEVAVFCSSEDVNCAEVGFFVRTQTNESWPFNAFLFQENRAIVVKGTGPRIGGPGEGSAIDTGLEWERDRWYLLRAEIDYASETIDFWIDGQQVANDLIAAPKHATSIFELSTHYGYEDAVVYFDSIRIETVNGVG